jgi:hypothetical protein
MLEYLVELCTTQAGWFNLIIASDLLIAIAYFSIPFSMLWVFRRRREDLPYPLLWVSFVLFIFACGMTHFVHAASNVFDMPLLRYQAAIHVLTALVSLATAVTLTMVLPKLDLLPSPERQRRELEIAVREASRQKEALLVELHHRVGNQLAKLSALARREMRTAGSMEREGIQRIQALLTEMGNEHHRLSRDGYGIHRPEETAVLADGTPDKPAS